MTFKQDAEQKVVLGGGIVVRRTDEYTEIITPTGSLVLTNNQFRRLIACYAHLVTKGNNE